MRKNLNTSTIQGYVYDVSKLAIKVSGESSKAPGTEFISGDLEIVVDDEGLNVVPVHFTYVTATYAKSGKPNTTFTLLKKFIENPPKMWINGDKKDSAKVKVDGTISLNDFYNNQDERISSIRIEGSFVSAVNELPVVAERSKFEVDMVINRINHVEANEERGTAEYIAVGGAVFNFRNELLPVEFRVVDEKGINWFDNNVELTGSEPIYTKVWGEIRNLVIKTTKTEESAWGEPVITTYENKRREYVLKGMAKVPYDFGEENVMTAEELQTAIQNREVMWAELKKRNDEYKASKAATNSVSFTPAANTAGQAFKF